MDIYIMQIVAETNTDFTGKAVSIEQTVRPIVFKSYLSLRRYIETFSIFGWKAPVTLTKKPTSKRIMEILNEGLYNAMPLAVYEGTENNRALEKDETYIFCIYKAKI